MKNKLKLILYLSYDEVTENYEFFKIIYKMVTINELAEMAMSVAGKKLSIKNIPGPLGVRGRNSDNTLYEEKLGWRVSDPLISGIEKTYPWIAEQVEKYGEDLSL